MKMKTYNNYIEALTALKAFVDIEFCGKFSIPENRRWLKSTPKSSYGEDRYKVEIWVLEGSPARLVVIVNHYLEGFFCFNSGMKQVARFRWGERVCI